MDPMDPDPQHCPHNKNYLLLSFMFNMSLILQVHVSIAGNSVNYTKFTTPRKQHSKVGLQKGTENGDELNPSAALF